MCDSFRSDVEKAMIHAFMSTNGSTPVKDHPLTMQEISCIAFLLLRYIDMAIKAAHNSDARNIDLAPPVETFIAHYNSPVTVRSASSCSYSSKSSNSSTTSHKKEIDISEIDAAHVMLNLN